MQPSFSQGIMKMNHAFRLRENKANQSQFQRQKMLAHLTISGRVAKKYRGELLLSLPKK